MSRDFRSMLALLALAGFVGCSTMPASSPSHSEWDRYDDAPGARADSGPSAGPSRATAAAPRSALARGSSGSGDLVPPWADQAASWEKLDAIESWLASIDRTVEPFWRIEAQLQLAEGRLDLPADGSAEGAGRGGPRGPVAADDAALALRRTQARSGLMLVLADRGATATQRARAEAAMMRAPREHVAAPTSAAGGFGLPRSSWGAREPVPANLTRNRAKWRYITIHHSAHEEGGGHGATGDRDAVAALQSIQRTQMDDRGWGDIGYHFIIDPSGRVWQGRDLVWQGAHAGGDGGAASDRRAGNGRPGNNNVANIGICLLGNYDLERPSQAAISALERLVQILRKRYSIPASGVKGHSEWKSTACPGRHLLPHVRRLGS